MTSLGRPAAPALVTATSPHPTETDRICYQDMVNIATFSHTEPRLHDDFIIRTVLKAINSTLNTRTTLSSVTSPPGTLPFASHPAQPARKPKRSLAYSQRPESPAQIGRSASGWSFPQIPQLPTPVQKTHKTFLQWKADAQAITTGYQRNGFSSPVAWVNFFDYFSLL